MKSRQAEGADPEGGGEDGKSLSSARLGQALEVEDGSGVHVRKFLAIGASHQSLDWGFGADSGTLQAIQTSHTDLVYHLYARDLHRVKYPMHSDFVIMLIMQGQKISRALQFCAKHWTNMGMMRMQASSTEVPLVKLPENGHSPSLKRP